MEITRAIATDLTGRSRCNRCQTIELWLLDPAEQVPRDASGLALQGGISIYCFMNSALFWDFSGEIAWSVPGKAISLTLVTFF
jgi:hypothetical protein